MVIYRHKCEITYRRMQRDLEDYRFSIYITVFHRKETAAEITCHKSERDIVEKWIIDNLFCVTAIPDFINKRYVSKIEIWLPITGYIRTKLASKTIND